MIGIKSNSQSASLFDLPSKRTTNIGLFNIKLNKFIQFSDILESKGIKYLVNQFGLLIVNTKPCGGALC